MAHHRWVAEVGQGNAAFLATQCRTARLAREFRPVDLGDGRVLFTVRRQEQCSQLAEETR
jgi:hypothetical protein